MSAEEVIGRGLATLAVVGLGLTAAVVTLFIKKDPVA
jgi:hypothetical protein